MRVTYLVCGLDGSQQLVEKEIPDEEEPGTEEEE